MVGEETSSGEKILASKEREKLKENIQALLPDVKVEVEDPWFGGARGMRPIKVDGISYNMVNLKDRQALMDKITSSMGIEPIVLQGGKAKEPIKKEEISLAEYNKTKRTSLTLEELQSQPWAKDYIIVE